MCPAFSILNAKNRARRALGYRAFPGQLPRANLILHGSPPPPPTKRRLFEPRGAMRSTASGGAPHRAHGRSAYGQAAVNPSPRSRAALDNAALCRGGLSQAGGGLSQAGGGHLGPAGRNRAGGPAPRNRRGALRPANPPDRRGALRPGPSRGSQTRQPAQLPAPRVPGRTLFAPRFGPGPWPRADSGHRA